MSTGSLEPSADLWGAAQENTQSTGKPAEPGHAACTAYAVGAQR